MDTQGLRPVFVRPLPVFVGWWLNTVDAERKRNDHPVDGTKRRVGGRGGVVGRAAAGRGRWWPGCHYLHPCLLGMIA